MLIGISALGVLSYGALLPLYGSSYEPLVRVVMIALPLLVFATGALGIKMLQQIKGRQNITTPFILSAWVLILVGLSLFAAIGFGF